MKRNYTCTIRHGGGFGGGYGGTYDSEHSYESGRRSHGRAGWCEVVPGSVRLDRD